MIRKRQGAKFCETKCRVAYNQQLKRDVVIRNEVVNKDEVDLAKMLTIGVETINLYILMIDAKISQTSLEMIKNKMCDWAKSVENSSIIKRISEEQEEKKTK